MTSPATWKASRTSARLVTAGLPLHPVLPTGLRRVDGLDHVRGRTRRPKPIAHGRDLDAVLRPAGEPLRRDQAPPRPTRRPPARRRRRPPAARRRGSRPRARGRARRGTALGRAAPGRPIPHRPWRCGGRRRPSPRAPPIAGFAALPRGRRTTPVSLPRRRPIEHHVHGLDPLAPGGARPGPRGATAGGAQNEDRRDQKGTDSPRAPRTCHEAATRRRSPAVTAPSAGVLVDHALSQEQWGCQRTMVMVTRVCVSIRLDQPGPTGWWWWWRGGDDWWDAAPVSP